MKRLLFFPFFPIVLAPLLVACGGPEPRTQQQMSNDGVPANSLSESRLGAKKPDDKDGSSATGTAASAPSSGAGSASDPTQPYMTPVGAGGQSATAGIGGGSDAANGGGGGDAPPKPDPKLLAKKGPVTKVECEQAADRGLDLLIASKPELQGIPPEMMAQFKQQARQEKGAASPCNGKGISRAEWACEMGATTFDQYRKCDKVKK